MPVKYQLIVSGPDGGARFPKNTINRVKELRLVHTRRDHAYRAGAAIARLPGVANVSIFRVERKCVMEFK